MLQPKKTKFRRQQKGRMKGEAQRGNQLAFGSFGIKSLENKWITGRQIEAARIAVTRYMQRQGQVWVRIFPEAGLDIPLLFPASFSPTDYKQTRRLLQTAGRTRLFSLC